MDALRNELESIVGPEYVITPERPEYWSYTFGDATMYLTAARPTGSAQVAEH